MNIESPKYLCEILKELSIYLYQMDHNYRQAFKDDIYYESINNSINRFNFSISACAKDIEDIMYKTKDEMGINR